MKMFTIASGTTFRVSDSTPLYATETVTINLHRKADSTLTIACTVPETNETVAEVIFAWHGCTVPYDYEDIATMIDMLHDRLACINGEPRGAYITYPETFTPLPREVVGLITYLS